ncbi:Blp family class II bacteriocin [Streptococcus sp. H31]|uniref:Blp family class II bacteriocin n=1 Tax=Streptococcus huangxiaojuni TaxID=3237239 RepID=UPI0034A2C695
MNIKTFEQFATLTDTELSAVEGGGCNWRDADKAGVAGGIGGLIGGGPVGGIAGIAGGLAAYGATYWW